MIKRKRIWKHLSRQFDGIQHNLTDMQGYADKEKLHELRLCSKKAKAITAFLQESLHHKKRYSIKELKELFHHAGGIRTAQMNLDILKDNGLMNEAFEKKQQEIIDADVLKLDSNKLTYSNTAHSLAKQVKGNVRSVTNKKIVAFYYDNIQLLSDSLRVTDESQLHDNRKIIKKLLYNLKLLPGPVLKKLPVNRDYLNTLQDIIGKWHDSVIAIDELAATPSSTGDCVEALQQIRAGLLQAVMNETKDFDAKVMIPKVI